MLTVNAALMLILNAGQQVGAAKARAVLDALTGTEVDPAQRPEVSPGRLLHAVTLPTPNRPGPTGVDTGPAARGSGPAALVTPVVDPGLEITATAPQAAPARVRRVRSGRWTLVLLALPAFVAIWSGWVGLGELTGFGPVHPLPGIVDNFVINSAITLPIGVEAYAAFALRVWLSESGSVRARRFAKRSAIGALLLGATGQIAYHLMTAPQSGAPWLVTMLVSCLPVVVLGCAAGLAHLIRDSEGGGSR